MVKHAIDPDKAPDVDTLADMEDEVTGSELAPMSTMALGHMGGDVSVSDMKFPRLQIAYGVGGLAENFSPGDLVLDKEHLLAKKKDSIRVVILNTNTYWKEYTVFGSGNLPRVFRSEKEALDAKLTTSWQDGQPPQCKKAMDMRLLIKKPDGLTCGLFGLKLGGDEWAPAIWSVDKTAYDRIAEKIIPVASFALREKGLLYGAWDLKTDMETKKNGNVVVAPFIKYAGINSDKLVNDINGVFGNS